MAKRIFSLPRIDELTQDQRRALRLPIEGQYLVVGSPGTGKSVVAILRAQKLKGHSDSLFLTFNHVLSHATNQLFDGEITSHTAMSWFYAKQWQLMDGKQETFEQDKMPERESHKPDYKEVANRFKQLNKNFSHYQIIIDEGQDLPPGWYECLKELGIENFFVVADQNQQITEEHSSRKDLENQLALNRNEVIELEENWRNVAPIAEFSNYFFTDKSSPKPAIPDKPSTDIPILFEYTQVDKLPKMILAEYDRDPSKLIGFIVPTDNKREWYVKVLGKDTVSRSNPKPIISTYSSQQKGEVNIDFAYGGIVVLADKSVKGIEFDTVFIIIDDFKPIANDIESMQKRFYVMSSRAKEKLFLFKCADRESVLEKILPEPGLRSEITGEEILKRRHI